MNGESVERRMEAKAEVAAGEAEEDREEETERKEEGGVSDALRLRENIVFSSLRIQESS